MERTEAYKNCINSLKDLYIRELKEICDDIDSYWDEYNDKELTKEDYIEAIKETLFFKFDALDKKTIAAVEYFECEPDEITEEPYDHYGLEVYSYGREEVAVGNDEEATAATTEEIKNSLWAFNVNFIESHMRSTYPLGERASKALERMLGELCEDANEIIESLIENLDEFIEDAISADGRGHFLSHYDGEENEIKIENETYYVYRIN